MFNTHLAHVKKNKKQPNSRVVPGKILQKILLLQANNTCRQKKIIQGGGILLQCALPGKSSPNFTLVEICCDYKYVQHNTIPYIKKVKESGEKPTEHIKTTHTANKLSIYPLRYLHHDQLNESGPLLFRPPPPPSPSGTLSKGGEQL